MERSLTNRLKGIQKNCCYERKIPPLNSFHCYDVTGDFFDKCVEQAEQLEQLARKAIEGYREAASLLKVIYDDGYVGIAKGANVYAEDAEEISASLEALGVKMDDYLEPCPFCGDSDCVLVKDGFDEYFVSHDCDVLGIVRTLGYETSDEAINAWNTRSKRTCQIDDGLRCTVCGYVFDIGPCDHPNFCMQCGAEVVDGD